MNIEIAGLVKLEQEMDKIAADLHGEPFLKAMRSAAMLVANDAKKNAPVDVGRLRASITPTVRVQGTAVLGVVGSNVVHSAPVEYGSVPHWPPIRALETWSRRHGIDTFLVARKIATKGIKEVRFLRNAMESNKDAIVDLLGNAVKRIVE